MKQRPGSVAGHFNAMIALAQPYIWRSRYLLVVGIIFFYFWPSAKPESSSLSFFSRHTAPVHPSEPDQTGTAPRKTQHASQYSENDVQLTTEAAPFTCDTLSLPRQVRMVTWTPHQYVTMGHGLPDVVSDSLWEGGWKRYKTFEMEEWTKAIQAIEPKRKAFVDLGANIGVHAVHMASQGFSVHAFEPAAVNYALLKCSLAYSGVDDQVRINSFGVGEMAYDSCLTITPGNSVHGPMRKARDCSREEHSSTGTLDKYHESFIKGKDAVATLMLDVSGYEIHALRGAKGFFKSAEAPVVVFFAMNVYAFESLYGQNRKELWQFFHDHEYTVFREHNTTAMKEGDFELFDSSVWRDRGWPAESDFVAVKTSWVDRIDKAGYTIGGLLNG